MGDNDVKIIEAAGKALGFEIVDRPVCAGCADWEEREALVCPENMGFEEYIKRLQSRIKTLESGDGRTCGTCKFWEIPWQNAGQRIFGKCQRKDPKSFIGISLLVKGRDIRFRADFGCRFWRKK